MSNHSEFHLVKMRGLHFFRSANASAPIITEEASAETTAPLFDHWDHQML
jgi:hypothetical protein